MSSSIPLPVLPYTRMPDQIIERTGKYSSEPLPAIPAMAASSSAAAASLISAKP